MTKTNRVETVRTPSNALIASALPRIDYSDAYRAALPAGRPVDVETLTRAFFTSSPGWVNGLMTLRDRLVALIGLKTSGSAPVQRKTIDLQPGASLGLFHVFQRSADEIVMGEDDKHLNFRVSILVQDVGSTRWAIMSTAVQFNSWLGKAYFAPVRVFHRIIAPVMLRRMVAAAR